MENSFDYLIIVSVAMSNIIGSLLIISLIKYSEDILSGSSWMNHIHEDHNYYSHFNGTDEIDNYQGG